MKLKTYGLARTCFQMIQKRLTSNSAIGTFGNTTSTLPFFKTSETNPANLHSVHLGRFYTIDEQIMKFLYGVDRVVGLPLDFQEQCRSLAETSILVRQPFLDIKQCIETYDPNLPTLRYVLYGIPGSGKTTTIINLVHYAYVQEYVIIHVPWMTNFARFITDTVPSTLRPDYYDHTTMAVKWLLYFKTQNSNLFKKLQLTTEREYVWTKRESTPIGSPLEEIVEHGIARPVFASESVYALIEQLKILSTSKKCKTMVLIDGANALYHDTWRIKRADKTTVPFTQITLFEAFRQAFKADWTGGVVISTVDKKAVPIDCRESDMPRYLLTKKGWEEMDPFVPVFVDIYSPQELQTTIDYFLERKWLQHPLAGSEKARKELEYISTRNPKTLMELCASR